VTARTPLEDLLIGGLDDWADAGWAVQSARLSLREGLMVAGDIVGNEHVPWHGDSEEWLERIRQEWLAEWGDVVPTPGAIVWLDNTPAGDQVAREVLDREAGG
jgi:hypothetical protein